MLDFTKIPNWPQRRIIFLPNQDETYPTIEACNKKMCIDIGANQMLAEVEEVLTKHALTTALSEAQKRIGI